MVPPSQSTHAIFPYEDLTNAAEDGTQTNMGGVVLARPIHGEPAKKRRRYNSRKTPAEWNLIKADIKKLYVDEDLSLEETIAELQANRRFEASKDQFKSKIKLWGFDKKVKTQEMKHIVRINKKRLPKRSSFTVRKQPVSRIKIERFMKGHPAFPEPPSRTPSAIGYRTSYSTEGTPSLNRIMSPRLGCFEWYRDYEEYRNQTPEFSFQPVFEILQKLRIQEDTWELRKSSKSQVLGFSMVKEYYASGGPIEKDCLGCMVHELFELFKFGRGIYQIDPNSLSAETNLRWWLSEIARLLQSQVEALDIDVVSLALHWSLHEGITIAADVFHEVSLELCRTGKVKDWTEKDIALDIVDQLILCGRLLEGEVLLRAIMKGDFNIINVPFCSTDCCPVWDDEPERSLYWRRAITQLVVIRWFLAHPDIKHKVFRTNAIPQFSFTACGGIEVNSFDFFLAGRCPDHPKYLSCSKNFIEEDKTTLDLIEGIPYPGGRRQRMRVLLGLSRYLPRYGFSIGTSSTAQASDCETQQKAGKEDENGIEDQGGTPFTGIQLGEHLLDREEENLGWWLVGSQGASTAVNYEGGSPTFNGYHSSPRASGFVLEWEIKDQVEKKWASMTANSPNKWAIYSKTIPHRPGSGTIHPLNRQTQQDLRPCKPSTLPGPQRTTLIDPPDPMSTFPGLLDTEQTPDLDLDEEATRMDTGSG
ncbi:MAG: hypothetical protein Q9197_000731 [Variospora fuerteventurae]